MIGLLVVRMYIKGLRSAFRYNILTRMFMGNAVLML